MRFGVVGYPSTFADLAAQVRAAEEAGFDGWFFSEHHQRDVAYQFGGNLEALAAVAALTSRIRLGTCVLLLPLHHPLALAESIGVIDDIAPGRFVLGVGLGYQREDFDAFGVDRRDRVSRFEEGLAVLRQVWDGGRVSFEGRHVQLHDVLVHPRPAAAPPVWVAAWTEAGVRRAARLGDAWIADPLHSIGALTKLREAYRDEATRLGRPASTVLTRFVALGDDEQDALRRHGAAIEGTFRFYLTNRAFTRGLDPWMSSVRAPEEVLAAEVVPDRIAVGSPETCARTLVGWAERIGAGWVLVTFLTDPARAHAETLAALRRFGDAVRRASPVEGAAHG